MAENGACTGNLAPDAKDFAWSHPDWGPISCSLARARRHGVNGGSPVLLLAVPASHVVVIILGGLGAGIFNGVAGGGSLISFPILLGLGYPALTANITNTIGIWPGYLASAAGFRKEIGDQRTRLLRLTPVGLAGGIVGAVLLLTTSVATFDDVVPWLVLGASALFAVQPLLRRALDRGSAHPRTRPVLLVVGVFVASVYGGYFGAAMGVMFLAVLGLALPISLAHTSGLRAVLSMIVNAHGRHRLPDPWRLGLGGGRPARPRQPGRWFHRGQGRAGPAGAGAARHRRGDRRGHRDQVAGLNALTPPPRG